MAYTDRPFRRCAVVSGLVVAAVMLMPVQNLPAESDSILASVGDEVLTIYDLKAQTAYAVETLRKQSGGRELEEQVQKLYRNVVRDFIERELVYAEFKSLETTLPADLIASRVDRIVMNYTGGDLAKFEELLAEKGVSYGGAILGPGSTMEDLEELVEKLLAVELLMHERVRRGIEIAPSAVKEYYDAHPDFFTEKSGVRLQVIVLTSGGKYANRIPETVREIYAKLAEGAAFGELAKTYSEGMNAEGGGLQDWMTDPNEKLRPIVASLSAGEVYSESVELGNNTYIIRLADRREGGLLPLDEALQEKISERLRQDEEQRRYEAFISELRTKYPVKNFFAASDE